MLAAATPADHHAPHLSWLINNEVNNRAGESTLRAYQATCSHGRIPMLIFSILFHISEPGRTILSESLAEVKVLYTSKNLYHYSRSTSITSHFRCSSRV